MSRTYRKIAYADHFRRPRYRWRLLEERKTRATKDFVTDWDDKPVAARKEVWKKKD